MCHRTRTSLRVALQCNDSPRIRRVIQCCHHFQRLAAFASIQQRRATLFLIGTSLSLATLRKVGARPLVLGVVLWVIVAAVSLWLIQQGWIAI